MADRVPPDGLTVPAHLAPDALHRLKARPLVARVHVVAGPEGEVLEVLALGRFHVRDRAPQREVAEVHVAPFVLQDVVEQLRERGVARLLAHDVEGGDGKALDDHLHPQELQLPEVGGQDLVQQRLEQRVDRVDLVELLDVALEDLDVPSFVDDLGRGVELRVELGNRVHELPAHDQGALLAVEELREPPRGDTDLDFLALLLGELREEIGPHEGHLHVQDRALGADRSVPVDRRRAVPLVLLGGLVQGRELVVRGHVVVVPQSLELIGHPSRRGCFSCRHALTSHRSRSAILPRRAPYARGSAEGARRARRTGAGGVGWETCRTTRSTWSSWSWGRCRTSSISSATRRRASASWSTRRGRSTRSSTRPRPAA